MVQLLSMLGIVILYTIQMCRQTLRINVSFFFQYLLLMEWFIDSLYVKTEAYYSSVAEQSAANCWVAWLKPGTWTQICTWYHVFRSLPCHFDVVVGWPWLAARCPPSPSVVPCLTRTREEKCSEKLMRTASNKVHTSDSNSYSVEGWTPLQQI